MRPSFNRKEKQRTTHPPSARGLPSSSSSSSSLNGRPPRPTAHLPSPFSPTYPSRRRSRSPVPSPPRSSRVRGGGGGGGGGREEERGSRKRERSPPRRGGGRERESYSSPPRSSSSFLRRGGGVTRWEDERMQQTREEIEKELASYEPDLYRNYLSKGQPIPYGKAPHICALPPKMCQTRYPECQHVHPGRSTHPPTLTRAPQFLPPPAYPPIHPPTHLHTNKATPSTSLSASFGVNTKGTVSV